MPRPKRKRLIKFKPKAFNFKPEGIPENKLDTVILERDELESLKLYNIDDLDQISAAKKMGISQPTFARIHSSAVKKVSEALISAKMLQINKS